MLSKLDIVYKKVSELEIVFEHDCATEGEE
jgi:hypothetical protein